VFIEAMMIELTVKTGATSRTKLKSNQIKFIC